MHLLFPPNGVFLLPRAILSSRGAVTEGEIIEWIYRVTHHVGPNLPLTSKVKFCFGLDWPG